MKLRRLWIDRFKNLRNCEVIFEQPFLLNAVIGGNGSGKSNLVEAILCILIDTYLHKSPPFDFSLEYEAQGRQVVLSATGRKLRAIIDEQEMSIRHFTKRLRDGDAQVYYPESTFAYYSGDCDRVQRLVKRYTRSFRQLVQKPEHDNFRPLFVLSNNQQARHILLSLIAHRQVGFLGRLNISGAQNIKIVLKSPEGFDSTKDEPLLWGTVGKLRKNIAALDETANLSESVRIEKPISQGRSARDSSFTETRTYTYLDNFQSNNIEKGLKRRLESGRDNLYLVLEHLSVRGILHSIEYELINSEHGEPFNFEQLSEGEKQLIAVVGAIRLTNQRDNLVLLDEPDTHLNPQWSWEYPEMLEEAFDISQRDHSTVLMATHDPVTISGLVAPQVFLANASGTERAVFEHPIRNPRGQGVANLLCSSEFFGLPSSLDKKTQLLMDERLRLSVKQELTDTDKRRLNELNESLEILQAGISERDPEYVAYLRSRHIADAGTE